MASPLSDLDELVLKCRDKKAQSYIREAVSCYKTGAFRSAIVSTWIAVSFDIIDKIKELSLAGDKEATLLLSKFEIIRQNSDLPSALKFERSLLDAAKDKLELISNIEHIDLSRLQEDRNRCAHPSMTAEGEIFNPSAELARLHIHSAVEYLLQYPPAQGKSALDRLKDIITSEYFPSTEEKALVTLRNSPLVKARDSLISNLVVVLIKQVIQDDQSYKQKMQLFSALGAVKQMYHSQFNNILCEKLNPIVEKLDDEGLINVLDIIKNIDGAWSILNIGLHQKISALVESLSYDKLALFSFLFEHFALSKHAAIRASRLTREELDDPFLFFMPPVQITDRVVMLYLGSSSFEQANSFAPVVRNFATDFSIEQIKQIIDASINNSQVAGSFEVASVIHSLKKNKNANDGVIDELLSQARTSKDSQR